MQFLLLYNGYFNGYENGGTGWTFESIVALVVGVVILVVGFLIWCKISQWNDESKVEQEQKKQEARAKLEEFKLLKDKKGITVKQFLIDNNISIGSSYPDWSDDLNPKKYCTKCENAPMVTQPQKKVGTGVFKTKETSYNSNRYETKEKFDYYNVYKCGHCGHTVESKDSITTWFQDT
ncbi:MAG: hypothetical protein FWC00_04235 [Firmicutes bacterium]|nr:hypothetical protein [Bacillota bacterium]